MSTVSLKLMTVLCLSCTALSSPESSGVVWRDFGEAITIQCRPPPVTGQDSLTLKKGLSDESVLFKNGNSETCNIAEEVRDRLQLNGAFPNMDILIKNLTSSDTGPYLCIYTKFDSESDRNEEMKGMGSVLLVVTGEPLHSTEPTHRCDQPNNNLILWSVGICAALSGIIIFFIIWLIVKAKMRTAKKPQRVPNNDVYEDMRGTIRR